MIRVHSRLHGCSVVVPTEHSCEGSLLPASGSERRKEGLQSVLGLEGGHPSAAFWEGLRHHGEPCGGAWGSPLS